MLNFIPTKLKTAILNSFDKVFEIRLRVGQDVVVRGLKNFKIINQRIAFQINNETINQSILALTDYSIYSKEDELMKGIITSSEGERVGVCGEFVYTDGKLVTVKNFSSLCIRFPNDCIGCSNEFFSTVDSPQSVLVVSPPFHGKTTFIRDLGRNYSDKFSLNVLFIDEKDELSGGGKFYLGKNSDVIRNSTKKFGFYNGVRAINPDVIICDELTIEDDFLGVQFSSLSGVKVIASTHSNSLEKLLKKENISKILKSFTFDKIVFLENFEIKKIYGEDEWQSFLSEC